MNRHELFLIADALAETNRRNNAKKQLVNDQVNALKKLVLFDYPKKNSFMCKLSNKKATVDGKLVTFIDAESRQILKHFYARSYIDAQYEALKWCTNQI